ncbi:tRNA-dihydrouridine synthase family protein, partial [Candidatus Saccharibacteria bacterium]|nr:tRNA-dihydrouridine synthase family protein [Candidatus Saccharibacteria bacterium]
MMTSIQKTMPKPLFILAPMDDVTDTVFRQVVHDCAPADLYFTEFVNVDGLMSPGRANLLKKLQFTAQEGPLVAQLWGLNPANFEAVARQIIDGTIAREVGVEASNFVGIDLNMGCPAKSEVKNGACSALIKNRPLAKDIIEATLRARASIGDRNSDFMVSVKTRVGFSEIDLSWIEFLLGFELDMLTVHWRTRKEMSKVPAHWELAEQVVAMRNRISPTTKVVGNGDVMTRQQGLELANQYSLDGIMIGRGVFGDPFVFADSSPWQDWTKQQRVELFIKHVELFATTWD